MGNYMSKPFNQLNLFKILKKWLQQDENRADIEQTPVDGNYLAEGLLDLSRIEELRVLGEKSGRNILGKSINHFIEQTLGRCKTDTPVY